MAFKFPINPDKESGHDTLCQNLRYLHRRATASGDKTSAELTAKCFDFAKRMNERLKYYHNKYEPWRVGPEIKEGHPPESD